jgi:nucleotide-binding universal stress UspA family protein
MNVPPGAGRTALPGETAAGDAVLRGANEEAVMSEQGSGLLGVVVVGVDGSDASKDALGWAGRYARLTGSTLHAVTAWQIPAELALAVAVPDLDPQGDAQRLLKETVGEVLEGREPVALRTSVVQGPPALVLEQLAGAADLLVVGSRGHGALAGILLGSVSEHCVHHAGCPVVVVHHRNEQAGHR